LPAVLSPGNSSACALYIDVFNTVSNRVAGMAKVVMIHGGAHVFPALTLVHAQVITSVDAIASQLIPHFGPLGMIDFKIFHTAAQHLFVLFTYCGLLNKFVKKVLQNNDFKGYFRI
jgi:hypothetical protein